jgi:serine/threonine protein kinase
VGAFVTSFRTDRSSTKTEQQIALAATAPKDAEDLIMKSVSNVMPWQKTSRLDRYNFAYLIRQYFAFNLLERLSARPLLLPSEKCWLAYQLLCGIAQAHNSGVVHGDIKCENVMVTSWGWLFLTDFSPFLPVVIPEVCVFFYVGGYVASISLTLG